MLDSEDQISGPGSRSTGASIPGPQSASLKAASFNRHELHIILNIYGQKVAAGEWRDYAIDLLKDRAIFSVYRRSTEFALYRIEKNPKLSRKQGAYSVVSMSGQILKRGHDLKTVLRVFEKRRLALVE